MERYGIRLIVPLLVVLALGSLVSSSAAQGIAFYVSTAGNDAWSGSLPEPDVGGTEGPFATIARARDAVRALPADVRGATPITVHIRGGRYDLSEPIVFGAQDSGTAAPAITYAAYGDERPVISGGRAVTGWAPAGGGVWKATVPGVAEGEWYFHQLFVSGRRAQRARSPNGGFFRVNGRISTDAQASFTYNEGDVNPAWAGLGDVEVIALVNWSDLRFPIVAVDPGARTVTLAGQAVPWSNWEENPRYWVENAPDALDEPGEWHLDRTTGEVRYRPLPGEDMTSAEVVAPALTQLVRIEGNPSTGETVSRLRFRGLTFSYADWSMGPTGYADMQAAYDTAAVVQADGARGVSIEGCTFEHLGTYAISFGLGCKNNLVLGSEIRDVGAGGVKIGEPVIRTAEEEKTDGNDIVDNHIHDIGIVSPGAVGVWVGQSGWNTIFRNHIHDTNYSGISVGWTWGYTNSNAAHNIIDSNHIHDIGRGMMSDMGCVYTLGVQPGTMIRNNVCHDVRSFESGYGGWGIYLDEGSSDIVVEDNIVYETRHGAFNQHYGLRNQIRNNILAFNTYAQVTQGDRPDQPHSLTFERNIVYWTEGPLLGGGWTSGEHQFDYNLYFNASGAPISFAGWSLAEWQALGQDVHSLIADPLFEDAGNHDFRLKPGSPAFSLGFAPIETVQFADVPSDHWAFYEIRACVEAAIVGGYVDATYRPNLAVSRDQMAVFVSRALAGGDGNVPTGPAEATFPDVPIDHWAFRHVEYAVANGIVEGYPEGDYRPAVTVDRGQMAVFIARAIATPTGEAGVPDAGCQEPVFPDVGCEFWARKYIQYIKERAITSGYRDGLYHPEYACTRDQMAVYVQRAFALAM